MSLLLPATRHTVDSTDSRLRAAGRPAGAETLNEFRDFPDRHRQHIRTTNPIESTSRHRASSDKAHGRMRKQTCHDTHYRSQACRRRHRQGKEPPSEGCMEDKKETRRAAAAKSEPEHLRGAIRVLHQGGVFERGDPLGQRFLCRIICEYLDHYRSERNHQGEGIDNRLLFRTSEDTRRSRTSAGRIRARSMAVGRQPGRCPSVGAPSPLLASRASHVGIL
jgi:hypothetical protein